MDFRRAAFFYDWIARVADSANADARCLNRNSLPRISAGRFASVPGASMCSAEFR